MTQAHKHTRNEEQAQSQKSLENDIRQNEEMLREADRKTDTLSFWQTLLSVGQASFGVQNQKNKERDFEKGSIKGFVAAALIFTVMFVLTLVVIVNVVLA